MFSTAKFICFKIVFYRNLFQNLDRMFKKTERKFVVFNSSKSFWVFWDCPTSFRNSFDAVKCFHLSLYKSLVFSLTLPFKKQTLQKNNLWKKNEEIKRKLFQFDFQTSFSFIFVLVFIFSCVMSIRLLKYEKCRGNKTELKNSFFWASKIHQLY